MAANWVRCNFFDMAAPEFPVNDEGWPLSPDGYEIMLEVGQVSFDNWQLNFKVASSVVTQAANDYKTHVRNARWCPRCVFDHETPQKWRGGNLPQHASGHARNGHGLPSVVAVCWCACALMGQSLHGCKLHPCVQGAFAKVMKARCPSKGAGVAIKIMALENITTSLEEIQAEVKTMKLSRDENVVDLFCCFVVKSDLWLVMPLMGKGSCYYVLRMLKKMHKIGEGQGLSEECIATIMRELLQGLDYIHSHGQIHRDIKAGNVLLNEDGRVAIADFGVAGWMSETGERGDDGPKKVGPGWRLMNLWACLFACMCVHVGPNAVV